MYKKYKMPLWKMYICNNILLSAKYNRCFLIHILIYNTGNEKEM
uniref:Uncharacterized protein n=1 Tax=Anguilla anguilla TaxID=7936 RepID=A0A0E9WZH2_ANGAN